VKREEPLDISLFLWYTIGICCQKHAVSVEVFEGGWQDGVKIEWACPSNTKGAIPFQITMTDGQIYRGIVSCGHPI